MPWLQTERISRQGVHQGFLDKAPTSAPPRLRPADNLAEFQAKPFAQCQYETVQLAELGIRAACWNWLRHFVDRWLGIRAAPCWNWLQHFVGRCAGLVLPGLPELTALMDTISDSSRADFLAPSWLAERLQETPKLAAAFPFQKTTFSRTMFSVRECLGQTHPN